MVTRAFTIKAKRRGARRIRPPSSYPTRCCAAGLGGLPTPARVACDEWFEPWQGLRQPGSPSCGCPVGAGEWRLPQPRDQAQWRKWVLGATSTLLIDAEDKAFDLAPHAWGV